LLLFSKKIHILYQYTIIHFYYAKREKERKTPMKKTLIAALLFTISVTAAVSAQQGWMSRYWDGCKPSCSWTNNAGGANNLCKECDIGNNAINPPNQSGNPDANSCFGGGSYTCWDMIPFAINDNLAYGFVATGPPNQCGSCYELTFTGQGEHTTNDNHRAIQGKKIIVMASNIGNDVASNQFDLLVPGGGLGQYDSFTGQTGISTAALGHQFGGILREFCETGTAAAQRTCLRDRCNSVFSASAHAMLRQGCVYRCNECDNREVFCYAGLLFLHVRELFFARPTLLCALFPILEFF
jgi:hypothetical protein